MTVRLRKLIGAIAKSGKTIYDSIPRNSELFLATAELEQVLREGLKGLNLKYPLRTRSKVLKSRVCKILGYPVPNSFRKTKPRFPGQDFDTYIQKSSNLQIFNEKITPTRRYVIIRLNASSRVVGLRVVTGEVIAKLDPRGTLTRKYQARSREPITRSVLLSKTDPQSVLKAIANHVRSAENVGKHSARRSSVGVEGFLPIASLYGKLLRLTGTKISDAGIDQERNRSAALHRAVCKLLGLPFVDNGQIPDVGEQLLELKMQTSPTIDLGMVLPDDSRPTDFMKGIRHCDLRYGVFYGVVVGTSVRIDHVVLSRGKDFFTFFRRFEGKVVNAKLQIPLPRNFFD